MPYKNFSKPQLAEIASLSARCAGNPALIADLQKSLRSRQHTLSGWKSSPPGKRGYLSKPDCAGELLLECRAARIILKSVNAPFRVESEARCVFIQSENALECYQCGKRLEAHE